MISASNLIGEELQAGFEQGQSQSSFKKANNSEHQKSKKHSSQAEQQIRNIISNINGNQHFHNEEEEENQQELNESIERKQKLAIIIKRIDKMKERKRAQDLVMNLRSRMLKSFDSAKFNLLGDKSFVYDERKFQALLEQQEKQNSTQKKKEISQTTSSDCNLDSKRPSKSALPLSKAGNSNLPSKQSSLLWCSYKLKMIIRTQKLFIIRVLQLIPIIQPSSTIKLCWDFLNMIVIIINLFFLPITVIFEFSYTVLVPLEFLYTMACIIFIDAVININTGFFDKGQVVKNHAAIIKHYVKKNMVTDFISVVPFLLSLYAERSIHNTDVSKGFKDSWLSSDIMKILKLFFFMKIKQFSQIIKKIEERFNLSHSIMNLLSLAKLLFTIILINHIFACLWVYVARIEIEGNQQKTWMAGASIVGEAWHIQYTTAYYFTTVTMITVGYGDILPKNQQEMLLCVLTMMIACGVFGYSLNEVGQIFSSFFKVDNEIKTKIATIQRFMSKKSINQKLQYQIREYLEYFWRESAEMDSEQESGIINQLSDSLKSRLMFEANKIALKDSPIFKDNFSKEVIEQTVPLISEIKYSPETLICSKNMYDDQSIFFIQKGSVEVILNSQSKHPHRLFTLKKGESFGAYTFFSGLPRALNIRSKEFTTVLKIKRNDFIQLISNFPEDHEIFCLIRDQITYLNDASKIGSKCPSCNSFRHSVNQCLFLHFIPNKLKLIKQFNDEENINNQKRVSFQRRAMNNKFKSSIGALGEVYEQAQQFYEANETLINLSDDDDFSEGYYSNSDHQTKEINSHPEFHEDNPQTQTKLTEKEEDSSQNQIHQDLKNIVNQSDNPLFTSQIFHQEEIPSNLIDVIEETEEAENSEKLEQIGLTKQCISGFVSPTHHPIIFTTFTSAVDKEINGNDQNSQNQNNSIRRVVSLNKKSDQNTISGTKESQPLNHAAQRPNQQRNALKGMTKRIVNASKFTQESHEMKNKNNGKNQKKLKSLSSNLYNSYLINKTTNVFKSKNNKLPVAIRNDKTIGTISRDQYNYEAIFKQLQILIAAQQNQNQIQQDEDHFFQQKGDNFNHADIFNHFDKMKIFTKYNPRLNYQSVISRVNQINKVIQVKPGKNPREKGNKGNKMTPQNLKLLKDKDNILEQRKQSKFTTNSTLLQNITSIKFPQETSDVSPSKNMIMNALFANKESRDTIYQESLQTQMKDLNSARQELLSPMNQSQSMYLKGSQQENKQNPQSNSSNTLFFEKEEKPNISSIKEHIGYEKEEVSGFDEEVSLPWLYIPQYSEQKLSNLKQRFAQDQ